MWKKLGIGALVVVALLGGGVYYLFSNLDVIVKRAVEKYGSQATQTSVRLHDVKLALAAGEGHLGGLRVANPSGFSSADALSLGAIDIKLDTQSLRGAGPIIIREIAIDAPQVNYERNLQTGNLETLRKNMTGNANQDRAKAAANDKAGEAGKGRKIIIDNLYVRNGKVSVSDAMVKAAAVSVDLPTMHLTNIGREKGGASPAEVAEQVMGVITGTAITVGAGALVSNFGTLGGVKLDKGVAGDALKGVLGR